jgi:hypothetical protein
LEKDHLMAQLKANKPNKFEDNWIGFDLQVIKDLSVQADVEWFLYFYFLSF